MEHPYDRLIANKKILERIYNKEQCLHSNAKQKKIENYLCGSSQICKKKNTYKETLEGNSQKCYNGGYLWIIKLQRLPPPTHKTLTKFLVYTAFIIRKNYKKEKKSGKYLCPQSS